MAVLHRLRRRGHRGLRVRRLRPLRRSTALIAVAVGALACRDEVPEELRPDALLRDSLGLTDDDAVHVVRIDGSGGRDRAVPARLSIRPGERVSFTTTDGRLHHVRFDTAVTAPGPTRWLTSGGRLLSPPLINRDSRWVVAFDDAPPGVYPFRLEGNGAPGGGVVEVTER